MIGPTYTPQLHNVSIPLSGSDPLRNASGLIGDATFPYTGTATQPRIPGFHPIRTRI